MDRAGAGGVGAAVAMARSGRRLTQEQLASAAAISVGTSGALTEKATLTTDGSRPRSVQAVSVPNDSVAVQVFGQVLPSTWGEGLYLPLDERPQTEARPVQLKAIPYFLWGNRGMESMRIWVPGK